VAFVTLSRPEKRNAVNDETIAAIDAFFSKPPADARVVILSGEGDHFSAGLDLSEHAHRDATAVFPHSRHWHGVMDKIQFGGLPVVAALQGAVMGGGLEIATSCHVRVAEPDCLFQLPEGRRGIFVGGGGSVRIARIIGADRMTEMMLTGRIYGTDDGLRLGLAHYAVGKGEALAKATELAKMIASNAPLSNHVMIQAITRIDDMSRADGLFAESLCASLTQTSKDAQEGLQAFLEKREAKFDR
jgi:enoyl-CoA hydratase/carnithine racemase